MSNLTFQIPGASGSEPLSAPSGLPSALTGGLSDTGSNVITLAFNLIFAFAAVLALIFIIYSGIQWITSGGEPDKVSAAKRRLTFAIIGLVIIVLSFLLVSVVITVLGGTPSTFLKFKT